MSLACSHHLYHEDEGRMFLQNVETFSTTTRCKNPPPPPPKNKIVVMFNTNIVSKINA
jgi:hypothetical protein